MKAKVRKVFIGWMDTASQVGVYRKGFEANGVETLCAIRTQHSTNVEGVAHYNLDAMVPPLSSVPRGDKAVEPIVRQAFRNQLQEYIWQKALEECDTFFFIWNSFKSDCSDYAELKRRGKRIITNFVGHDIRWGPAMEQEFARYSFQPIEYQGDPAHWMKLPKQLHYLRTAERYSDIILSLTNQAQLELRPCYNFYYPLDLTRITEHNRQRKTKPVVLHVPTNPEIKGTRYVLDAFKRLKTEGVSFEGKLIQKVPHHEILRMYEQADILVYQLLCPGGGKQAYELLAAGKVVLTRMGYDHYPQVNAGTSPIIDAGPETIYEKLKDIILDYPKRAALAKKGRPYVEKHHDVVKLCRTMIDRLESHPGEEDYDLYPGFFRDHYVPESSNNSWLYNKYTNYVKDCRWYRRYVEPGQREGLRF
ncbi:MAG: glycosyltransferase [bacterium]|nr:glycosyltransferase [bacterium]